MSGKITPSFDTKRCTLGKVLPLNTPFRVTLDTSEVCNFKCSYCFRTTDKNSSWGYSEKNGIMSMDTFKKAANQLLDFPEQPRVIALSGSGEPLFNRHIPEMVTYIKKLGFRSKLEIHTNASLFTEMNVKDYAECGFNKIVVSLQGLDANDYFKVCKAKINYSEFFSCLKKLYELKTSETTINIKIVDIAIPRKEDEERFFAMFSPIADHIFIEKVIALWQEQIDYDKSANVSTNKFGSKLGEVDRCPILFTNLTVSPEGDIWPCCVINPPFCLGNINEISLLNAWNSSERTEFLIKNLDEGHYCNEKCKKCFFPKGYAKTDDDIIDSYAEEIKQRLQKKG